MLKYAPLMARFIDNGGDPDKKAPQNEGQRGVQELSDLSSLSLLSLN